MIVKKADFDLIEILNSKMKDYFARNSKSSFEKFHIPGEMAANEVSWMYLATEHARHEKSKSVNARISFNEAMKKMKPQQLWTGPMNIIQDYTFDFMQRRAEQLKKRQTDALWRKK